MKRTIAVHNQVPSYVQEQYPAFVDFLEAYYKWFDNSYSLGTYEELVDLDDTIDRFVKYFRKQLDIHGVTFDQTDKNFLKHIKELYSAKGSTEGIDLFFKTAFSKTPAIYTPWEDTFKPSANKWVQPTSIIATITLGDATALPGTKITITDAASDVHETYVESVDDRGSDIFEIFINRLTTTGILTSFTNEAGTITGTIETTTEGIKITRAGSGFEVGQLLSADKTVVTTTAIDTQTIDDIGSGTVIRVKDVDGSGGITDAEIVEFGTGYLTDSNIPFHADGVQPNVINLARSFHNPNAIDGSAEDGTNNMYLIQPLMGTLENTTEYSYSGRRSYKRVDAASPTGPPPQVRVTYDFNTYGPLIGATGTISTVTGGSIYESFNITGVNTAFTTDEYAGKVIYNAAGEYIGVIQDVNSATSISCVGKTRLGQATNEEFFIGSVYTPTQGSTGMAHPYSTPTAGTTGTYAPFKEGVRWKAKAKIKFVPPGNGAFTVDSGATYDGGGFTAAGGNIDDLVTADLADMDNQGGLADRHGVFINSPFSYVPPGITIELDTTDKYSGTQSLKLTSGATGAIYFNTSDISPYVSTDGHAQGFVYVKCSEARRVGIRFYESTGTRSFCQNSVVLVPDTWTKLQTSYDGGTGINSAAAYTRFTINTGYASSATDTGDILWIDSAYVWENVVGATEAWPEYLSLTGDINYDTSEITVPSHGFGDTNKIIYTAGADGAIGGLVDATEYYIVAIDDDTIKLATSDANAALGSTGATGFTQTYTFGATGTDHYFEPDQTTTAFLRLRTIAHEEVKTTFSNETFQQVLTVGATWMPFEAEVEVPADKAGDSSVVQLHINVMLDSTEDGQILYIDDLELIPVDAESLNYVLPNGTHAVFDLSVGGQCIYPGHYDSSSNILGDECHILDSKYYQLHSYETIIDEELDKYKELLKSVIHPAGSQHFGRYSIDNAHVSTATLGSIDVEDTFAVSGELEISEVIEVGNIYIDSGYSVGDHWQGGYAESETGFGD